MLHTFKAVHYAEQAELETVGRWNAMWKTLTEVLPSSIGPTAVLISVGINILLGGELQLVKLLTAGSYLLAPHLLCVWRCLITIAPDCGDILIGYARTTSICNNVCIDTSTQILRTNITYICICYAEQVHQHHLVLHAVDH